MKSSPVNLLKVIPLILPKESLINKRESIQLNKNNQTLVRENHTKSKTIKKIMNLTNLIRKKHLTNLICKNHRSLMMRKELEIRKNI